MHKTGGRCEATEGLELPCLFARSTQWASLTYTQNNDLNTSTSASGTTNQIMCHIISTAVFIRLLFAGYFQMLLSQILVLTTFKMLSGVNEIVSSSILYQLCFMQRVVTLYINLIIVYRLINNIYDLWHYFESLWKCLQSMKFY